MDWEDLRFFVALARYGSLSATARALKVNHATVARRIAALEAGLGVALFERRADGYVLTQQGRAIVSETSAMAQAAASIRDRLDLPSGPSGRVRLTTIYSVAELILAPRLADVLAGLPAIELEILTDIRVQSLAQREADIALRLGRPKDSELIGRHVATLTYAFFATQEVAENRGQGEPAPLIGFDRDSDPLVAEQRWLTHLGPQTYALRSSSAATQASAAAAGLGIVMLPRFLARKYPSLQEIDFADPMPARELWVLAPASLIDVPRVRAIWDRLLALFEGLEGL